MTPADAITEASILRARDAIAGAVRETPLEHSPSLTQRMAAPVALKLELVQVSGSFKLRGAANAVANLRAEQRAFGVCAVSTGNHGRALAHAARTAGVRCVICMGSLVPQNKIDGIEALGAEVRIVGSSQDDAEAEVEKLTDQGLANLPPFDHADVIAGAGTLGLELLDQAPRGSAMYESQRAGEPVLVPELPTLADALGGGIGLRNRYTFRYVRDLCDDLVLVDERAIADAIRHAYWEERLVVEGAGAVGIAALLTEKVALEGPTAVLLTGRNIDMRLHHRIVSGETPDLPQED
jgi:threonine dehydratase